MKPHTKKHKAVIAPDPVTAAIIEAKLNPIPPPISLPIPATTTEQQDLTTAGQRRVNLIWEFTQAFIAIVVILANMTASIFNVFMGKNAEVPILLSSSLFLIIGFYFSRTNHQAIGGVGSKPEQRYEGR